MGEAFLPGIDVAGRSGERRFTTFSPELGVSWQASNVVQEFGNSSRCYEPR